MTGCATQFKAVLDHEENRNNWCGCCLENTKDGLFSSVYNNDSRKNSEIYLDWKKIYTGSQETIGQGLEYNGSVYFPVENGKGLIYNNGNIKESVTLRHSSLAIVYKDQPCFVSSEDSGEYLINAENGNKILKLATGAKVGIPMSAAPIPDSKEYIIVLADNNGKEQLITTDGVSIPLPLVTSVVNWNGKIMAGAAGVIYTVDIKNKSVKKYENTGSKMINYMWHDTSNNVLWVGCSANDQLMYFDNLGKSYAVIEFTDDVETKYFDTRVTKGWFLRNKNTRAQWYKIEKK
jgi:hypothetical protein